MVENEQCVADRLPRGSSSDRCCCQWCGSAAAAAATAVVDVLFRRNPDGAVLPEDAPAEKPSGQVKMQKAPRR